MQRNTIVALVGLSAAGVLAGGALALSARNEQTLQDLTRLCAIETRNVTAKAPITFDDALESLPPGFTLDPPAPGPSEGPWNKYAAALDASETGIPSCRPEVLPQVGATAGLQERLVAAQQATFSPDEWVVLAYIVAIASALPWFWYFLLRRIAELRAAIGGHPPAG